MARVLINFIYRRAEDEYKLGNPDLVFFDQQVAVLETEDDIKRPLVVPIRGMLTVVDRDRFEQVHKKFYLVADEQGNVQEAPNGAPTWLPKDTDVSKLRYINNQLVKVEDENPPEQKQEKEKETKNAKEQKSKPGKKAN